MVGIEISFITLCLIVFINFLKTKHTTLPLKYFKYKGIFNFFSAMLIKTQIVDSFGKYFSLTKVNNYLFGLTVTIIKMIEKKLYFIGKWVPS